MEIIRKIKDQKRKIFSSSVVKIAWSMTVSIVMIAGAMFQAGYFQPSNVSAYHGLPSCFNAPELREQALNQHPEDEGWAILVAAVPDCCPAGKVPACTDNRCRDACGPYENFSCSLDNCVPNPCPYLGEIRNLNDGNCYCPSGEVLSYFNSTYQCAPPCPEGQWRNSSGQCVPIICQTIGATYVSGQGCVCPGDTFQQWNGSTYECLPPCPEGQWRNSSGQCAPIICQTIGATYVSGQGCVCPGDTFQQWNGSTYECLPPCPDGQYRNNSGQCVPVSCSIGATYVSGEGCVCPNGTFSQWNGSAMECLSPCPEGQWRNSSGQCVSICPIGATIINAVCVCPSGTFSQPNGSADECLPPCPEGQWRNSSGQCVPIICQTIGATYVSGEGCVCPGDTFQQWNGSTYECLPVPPPCPEGSFRDTSGVCRTCPEILPGSVYSPNIGCVCSAGTDYYYNPPQCLGPCADGQPRGGNGECPNCPYPKEAVWYQYNTYNCICPSWATTNVTTGECIAICSICPDGSPPINGQCPCSPPYVPAGYVWDETIGECVSPPPTECEEPDGTQHCPCPEPTSHWNGISCVVPPGTCPLGRNGPTCQCWDPMIYEEVSDGCIYPPGSANATIRVDVTPNISAQWVLICYDAEVESPLGYGDGAVTATVSPEGSVCELNPSAFPGYNYPPSVINSKESFEGNSMIIYPGDDETFFASYTLTSTPLVYNLSVVPSGDLIIVRAPTGYASGNKMVEKVRVSGDSQPVGVIVTESFPSGIEYSFDGNRNCAPTCQTNITFNVFSTVPAGTYPVTITGSPSSNNGPVQFNLIIQNPPNWLPVSCTVTPKPNQYVNQPVAWRANYSGAAPGLVTVNWQGSGMPIPARGNPYTIRYSTVGLKTAVATVVDSAGNRGSCLDQTDTVRIIFDPTILEI